MTTVLFPDAAGLVVAYLAGELNVPVGTRVPNPRPARFVKIARHGGVALNRVTDGPQISVEAWDATEEEAHDLAQRARSRLWALRGSVLDGVTVYQVTDFAGPQSFPDPDSTQARYVFAVQLGLRGSAA